MNSRSYVVVVRSEGPSDTRRRERRNTEHLDLQLQGEQASWCRLPVLADGAPQVLLLSEDDVDDVADGGSRAFDR